MNQFHAGAPGGGNLGFALEALTNIELRVSERDEVKDDVGGKWDDDRAQLILHVLRRWRELTGCYHMFSAAVHRANPPHIGLASSAALQLTSWIALNYMHGHPFSDARLRSEMAAAYMEATPGSGAVPGFTTGLSSFLGLYGGFAVVDDDLGAVLHVSVPEWSAAVVVPRGLVSMSWGEVEAEALTMDGPRLDHRDRDAKSAIISDQLIPAVVAGELAAVGRAITQVQSVGSKVAEIAIYVTL
ncbi:MAG: hypothetical protein ACHQ01_05585 [Candidatus Limnocylindrales bacterium]